MRGNLKFRSESIFSRWLQPWQKKRGHRRTGSKVAGNVSEGLWFASILIAGTTLSVALITSRVTEIPGLSTMGTGSGLWLAVIVLASFILIGGGGLILTILRAGASEERRKAITSKAADIDLLSSGFPDARDYPTIPRIDNFRNSPGSYLTYRLPALSSPTWRLLVHAIFSLMWNGVLAALAVVIVKGFLQGQVHWFLGAILIGMAVATVRITGNFLRLLTKSLRIGMTAVEVSDLPLYPGQRYDIALVQTGRMALESIKLMLACDEKATFREGTDVRIENRRVFFQKVMQCESVSVEPGAAFVHQGELVVPTPIMHSFQSASNAIQWKLIVQAVTRGNDEFERVFPVIVFPSPLAEED